MGFLGSLLPGVRHIRGPLAAGYLWLLVAVVPLSGSWPKREEASGLASAIYGLEDASGVVGLGVAASFAAYLLGSLSEALCYEPLRAFGRRVGLAVSRRERSTLERFLVLKVGASLTEMQRVAVRDDETQASQGNERRDYMIGAIAVIGGEIVTKEPYRAPVFSWSNEDLVTRVIGEFDELSLQLIADQPAIYAEVDRFRAEAEFRLAITAPLATVAGEATTFSILFVLAIPMVLILYLQGLVRQRTANNLMSQLLRRGLVKSEILAGFEERAQRAIDYKPPVTLGFPQAEDSVLTADVPDDA